MKDRVWPTTASSAIFMAVLPLTSICSCPAAAQEAARRDAKSDDNEIVVRASPGNLDLIDRETYLVSDTPLAQTKTAAEVIQNLPSVTRDSSGQLRLLGSGDVQILIDGRRVPNSRTVIDSLQASQIARIEVMTNPSAQFSAYGSAGIINIILRRRFRDGLGGSAVISAGDQRYLGANFSPTWSGGDWSISLLPSANRSDSLVMTSLQRSGPISDVLIDRTESGSEEGVSRTVGFTAQIGFKRSDREQYNLSGTFSHMRGESQQDVRVSFPSLGIPSFHEFRGRVSRLGSESVSIERKATTAREGEEFTAALSWSHDAVATRGVFSDFLPPDTLTFANAQAEGNGSIGAKLDYRRPVGDKRTLSIGAELQWDRSRFTDSSTGQLLSGAVNTSNRFNGRSFDASAYATFQTNIGSLKLLPGFRVQRRVFTFDQGSGVAPLGQTLLFPSLHLERTFGKVTATFSVSRRADWPAIGQFLPYRRITGPTSAETGNASLVAERTLAIEAGSRFSIADQKVSVTLYSRRRDNVRDTLWSVGPDGQILSTPVNVGDRLSRGGQISVRGRFSKSLRYSVSSWIADARFDSLESGLIVREKTQESGGNAQLEYTKGKQDEAGFQQATVNLRYQGPLETLQSRAGGIVLVDLSYTRFLTDRLSLVASLNRLFGTRTVVTQRLALLFDERSTTSLYGPIARLSLTYKLGK